MKPKFTIVVDGSDITNKIKDRLISLTVVDEAGRRSDEVTIVIDDRDGSVELPRTGAEMTVSIGDENALEKMGIYTVDKLTLSGFPEQISIHGRAANFASTLKATKSRSWDDVTIGDMIATIAGEHDLESVVGDDIKSINITHIDQTEESDIHLLTRLGEEVDAVAKPTHKKLVFVKRGQGKSASGETLPSVTIKKSDVSTYSAPIEERLKYQSVKANWHDQAANELKEVTAGSGSPTFTMRHSYPDLAKATRAAETKYKVLKRGKVTLNLLMKGNARIYAEAPLTTEGFRDGVNGSWTVNKVTHTLTKDSFKSTVDAEIKG